MPPTCRRVLAQLLWEGQHAQRDLQGHALGGRTLRQRGRGGGGSAAPGGTHAGMQGMACSGPSRDDIQVAAAWPALCAVVPQTSGSSGRDLVPGWRAPVAARSPCSPRAPVPAAAAGSAARPPCRAARRARTAPPAQTRAAQWRGPCPAASRGLQQRRGSAAAASCSRHGASGREWQIRGEGRRPAGARGLWGPRA